MTSSASKSFQFDDKVPSFREAFFVWLKIGLLSFGGPAGQIALMHRILIEEKKWANERQFLNALNFCMLLPGPEAQQLAIYFGWLLHRAVGGLIAGILFVLPGSLVILGLSIVYVEYSDLKVVDGLFFGIKAVVIAIVIDAVLRISKRALKTKILYAMAGAAFIAIFFFAIPFPIIVISAGAIGLLFGLYKPELLNGPSGSETTSGTKIGEIQPVRRTVLPAIICLILWALPVGGLVLFLGSDHVFTEEAVFFSKMAVVTFGGAYAVLAYVAQQAVEVFGWLSPGEMVDGLGLAETTPGPLIMVVQFVGFLGAYRADLAMDPLMAGIFGAMITTWVTFVPCFLWIFIGAPFIERLSEARALSSALTAITSAIVGVVLNLAIWFAIHVLFSKVEEVKLGPLDTIGPDLSTLNPVALVMSAAALIMMLRFKVGMLKVLTLMGMLGAGYSFLI